jgi:hypothetical protein
MPGYGSWALTSSSGHKTAPPRGESECASPVGPHEAQHHACQLHPRRLTSLHWSIPDQCRASPRSSTTVRYEPLNTSHVMIRSLTFTNRCVDFMLTVLRSCRVRYASESRRTASVSQSTFRRSSSLAVSFFLANSTLCDLSTVEEICKINRTYTLRLCAGRREHLSKKTG